MKITGNLSSIYVVPKIFSLQRSGSWWLQNQLRASWSCPETVAKAGPNLQTCWSGMWLWWEQRVFMLWRTGSITVQGVHMASRAWGIYTALLSLCLPQSSGLVSNKGSTSDQLEGPNAGRCSPFPLGVWSTCTKAEVLPFLLTSPVAHSMYLGHLWMMFEKTPLKEQRDWEVQCCWRDSSKNSAETSPRIFVNPWKAGPDTKRWDTVFLKGRQIFRGCVGKAGEPKKAWTAKRQWPSGTWKLSWKRKGQSVFHVWGI